MVDVEAAAVLFSFKSRLITAVHHGWSVTVGLLLLHGRLILFLTFSLQIPALKQGGSFKNDSGVVLMGSCSVIGIDLPQVFSHSCSFEIASSIAFSAAFNWLPSLQGARIMLHCCSLTATSSLRSCVILRQVSAIAHGTRHLGVSIFM